MDCSQGGWNFLAKGRAGKDWVGGWSRGQVLQELRLQ